MTMRSHVLQAVSDQEGNLLANALVTIYDATGVPFGMPMYFGSEPAPMTDASGNAVIDGNGHPVTADQPLSNPYTTQDGVIDFWLNDPARLILTVNPPGDSPAFNIIYDAMPPASELVLAASGLKIVNEPVAGQVLLALDAATAQWVTPPGVVTPPPTESDAAPGTVLGLSVDTTMTPISASWTLPSTGGPITSISLDVYAAGDLITSVNSQSMPSSTTLAALATLGPGDYRLKVTTTGPGGSAASWASFTVVAADPTVAPSAVTGLTVDTSQSPPVASWTLPVGGGSIDHLTVTVLPDDQHFTDPGVTLTSVDTSTSLPADMDPGSYSVSVATVGPGGSAMATAPFTLAAPAPPELIQNFAALPDTTGLTWTWTYPSDPATWTYISMMLKDPDGIPFQGNQWPTSITPDSYQTLGDTFNISYGGVLPPGTYTLQTWVYFSDGDGNQTLVDSMTKQVTV